MKPGRGVKAHAGDLAFHLLMAAKAARAVDELSNSGRVAEQAREIGVAALDLRRRARALEAEL